MPMSTGMRLRPFSRMRTTVHSKPESPISAEHPVTSARKQRPWI